MSIYHFGQMKVIGRSAGRSAVGASAYISGEKLKNEYDGITHDYTKKQGVIFNEVMLPQNAPKEWENREILWNEVEKIEKSKNSQLARSFEVGLQTEFTLEENIKLIRSYVQNNFVDKGMCADVCIHDKHDGNPHAHVILTMRKIDDRGMFLPKIEKQYFCRNEKGEERYFNSKELKENKDFEKIYKCKCNGEYKELTNSELKKEEYRNYKKISKYPLDQSKDMCADWNDQNNVELWRENWAKVNNALFKEKGLDIRIDHRSYKRQELNIVPTIHEGYGARLRVKRGKESDRININKCIKSINEKIQEYEKDIQQLKDEILELDNNTEKISVFSKDNIRKNIEILNNKLSADIIEKLNININDLIRYMDKMGIRSNDDMEQIQAKSRVAKHHYEDILDNVNSYLSKMENVYDRILHKEKEINSLKEEVSELGIFNIKRKKQLNRDIEHLEGEIKELRASEYFQKNKTYSDKFNELTETKNKCIEAVKLFDKEENLFYNIKLLNENKEILINKDREKNINIIHKARTHSNELEL